MHAEHPLNGSLYFNEYTRRRSTIIVNERHGIFGVFIGATIWHLVYNDGAPSLGGTPQQ